MTVRQTQQSSSSSSSSSSSNSKLPTCHPIPLTVPKSSNVVNPYADHHSTSSIVIAHRGASAHLPEHSLSAYRLALELGADYLEPDIVATADNQLVALHTLDLASTTNVEEVFPPSRKTPSEYKNGQEGYWIYTFTLEEIKTLRLNQRIPGNIDDTSTTARSQVFDGLFQIPTLTEILELIVEWNSSIQSQRYNGNATLLPVNADTTSITNVHYQRKPPGPGGRLYAELKSAPWILQDANINLVDLFFNHMKMTTTGASSSSSSLWYEAIFQYMCHTKVVSTDYSYNLPPLIVQAFEPDVLQNFTYQWQHYSQLSLDENDDNNNSNNSTDAANDSDNDNNDNNDDDPSWMFTYPLPSSSSSTTTTSTTRIPLPVPPTILLVPHTDCHDFDHFWYDIQDEYRDVISGIGPDKNCFFSVASSSSASEQEEKPLHILQRDIMDLAVKMDWVVHPWTERPETTYLATPGGGDKNSPSPSPSPYFANVLEEIMYLKCVVGVHGVFSESVDIAVRAMSMSCPVGFDLVSFGQGEDDGNDNNPTSAVQVISHQKSTIDSSSSSSTSTGSSTCPQNGSSGSTIFNNGGDDIPLGPVILLSFTMGLLVALFLWCGWQRIILCRRRHRGGVSLSGTDGISTTTPSNNGSSATVGSNGSTSKIMNGRNRRTTKRQHDHSALPTSDDGDDYDDGDLELTEADREML